MGVSVMPTKFVGALVVLAFLGFSTSGLAQQLLPWQQEILDAHNALRSEHCTPALTWDSKLAAGAQQWADRCVWKHSDGGGGAYGENLAGGLLGEKAASAVGRWYEEKSNYDFSAPGDCLAKGTCESIGETGHFTQVVWRDSKQLGCGMATCPGTLFGWSAGQGNAIFYVCRYSPPGNVDSGAIPDPSYEQNVRDVCQSAEPALAPEPAAPPKAAPEARAPEAAPQEAPAPEAPAPEAAPQEAPAAEAPAPTGPASAEWRLAGPIRDNSDAQRKCPKVCGRDKWDGNWKTTQIGKNSACKCLKQHKIDEMDNRHKDKRDRRENKMDEMHGQNIKRCWDRCFATSKNRDENNECRDKCDQAANPAGGATTAERQPPDVMRDTFVGCTWGKVEGAHLEIWAYSCGPEHGNVRIVADDTLPGFVAESAGPDDPDRGIVVQAFAKAADAPIDAILDTVRAASPGPHSDTCVFAPAPALDAEYGAGHFTFEPTGAAKTAWDASEAGEGVGEPPPCGKMGQPSWYGGDRYFQVLPNDPQTVVFVELGSEIQPYDVNTLAVRAPH